MKLHHIDKILTDFEFDFFFLFKNDPLKVLPLDFKN